MANIELGVIEPVEQPDSGALSVRSDEILRTLRFKGEAAAVEALRPEAGDAYEVDWEVVAARVVPLAGGLAELNIELKPIPGGDEGTPTLLSTTWEVDWRSVEKPLQNNPKLFPNQDSDTYFEACDDIAAWQDSPQQRKRRYQVPKRELKREANVDDDDDWLDLAGDALKVAKKMARGTEAWMAFHPVMVKRSVYDSRPETGGCGMIETPPVAVEGYTYLKTGDTATQQDSGNWQRTETWQGAEEIDTDLYDEA